MIVLISILVLKDLLLLQLRLASLLIILLVHWSVVLLSRITKRYVLIKSLNFELKISICTLLDAKTVTT